MEPKIHKGDQVETADGVSLGQALVLYRRLDEVDPDLKLYEFYLESVNLNMGDEFYLPTDFIDRYENGTVYLSLTMAQVQAETMMRMPKFVAARKGERIALEPGKFVEI